MSLLSGNATTLALSSSFAFKPFAFLPEMGFPNLDLMELLDVLTLLLMQDEQFVLVSHGDFH